MPKIHNPDWNSLKLSDFPQFKCLCELCDCGCFERSKKKHTTQCKKFITKISDAFESSLVNPHPFNAITLYAETYKNFDFKPQDKNFTPKTESGKSKVHIKAPQKHGPKESNIELPDKNIKLTSHTTNKDHFKLWDTNPSKIIPEYPEFTSRLLYPSQQRDLLTTNEALFYKNYGKHKADASSLNIFENTFKISQGKMNLDTVYTKDFHKINVKEFMKQRGPTMTKEFMESKNKSIIARIPMDVTTQNMLDFSYDPEAFKKIAKKNKEPYSIDAFKSRLKTGLKPEDSDNYLYDSNYSISFSDKTDRANQENICTPRNYQPSFADSNLTHNRNIRFISTLDNQFIPSLKVKKTIIKNSDNRKESHASTSFKSSIDLDEKNSSSTYKVDFKDRGVDVCMAKAYDMISNKLVDSN